MPEEQRKRLRDMRLDAAARGVRVADPRVAAADLRVAGFRGRARMIGGTAPRFKARQICLRQETLAQREPDQFDVGTDA